MTMLLLGTYGRLALAQPLTVCNELANNVTDSAVLVERYGKDASCPYELQALLVGFSWYSNE